MAARAKSGAVASMQSPIGFVGVGNMGGPMARRLIERGFRLVVHDTDAAAVRRLTRLGAEAAPDAKSVADRTALVFASLPYPAVVRDVALGARGVVHGRKLKIFVDLSTTGTVVEKAVGAGLAKRGVVLVDAPVSGGPKGAAAGTLAVMVAGPAPAIAKARPALEVFGRVFVAGTKPGQAQILKLLNNLLSFTALSATCEVMVAGVKAGLDPDLMIEAINAGSGRNSATQDKVPRTVLTRSFDFGFPISGGLKDVSLAVEECQAQGVPMWVGGAVRQLWQYAYARGGGARDISEIVRYIEDWAGVEVRGRAARGRARKAPAGR